MFVLGEEMFGQLCMANMGEVFDLGMLATTASALRTPPARYENDGAELPFFLEA